VGWSSLTGGEARCSLKLTVGYLYAGEESVTGRRRTKRLVFIFVASGRGKSEEEPPASRGDGTKLQWAFPPAESHGLLSLSQPSKSVPYTR